MIQLDYKSIQAASITHLASVQLEINGEATFEEQVKKAKSKWSSKTSSNAGKVTFDDAKAKLVTMCSGAEICVYCEHNEATDIEHIYPKRLYPAKAFDWNNYVLACGKCNTHFKKDKFSVFNPAGGVGSQDITPKQKQYSKPPNEDCLFINQRVENPMNFLELDFQGKTFYFIEKHSVGTRDYEKAKYTKSILGLNNRDDLVQHRIAAFNYYKGELSKYVSINQTQDLNGLIQTVDNFIDVIDIQKDFGEEKKRILLSIKQRILKHNHPTVWKEMIRQRATLPETNLLFTQAAEALTW